MPTRKLSPEETADLRKAYCQSMRLRPKELMFILAASFVLSVPFIVLFVLVSHFGHGDTWIQALRNGSYAIGVGPGVVVLILLVVGISSLIEKSGKKFSSICKEISAGVCRTTRHQVTRVWELVDDGDEDSPDYLVELETGAAVAIPRSFLVEPALPRESLEIALLPKSGIPVGPQFSGEPLPIRGRIVTDNVWRNDDLPHLTPISRKDLPSEAIAAFESCSRDAAQS